MKCQIVKKKIERRTFELDRREKALSLREEEVLRKETELTTRETECQQLREELNRFKAYLEQEYDTLLKYDKQLLHYNHETLPDDVKVNNATREDEFGPRTASHVHSSSSVTCSFCSELGHGVAVDLYGAVDEVEFSCPILSENAWSEADVHDAVRTADSAAYSEWSAWVSNNLGADCDPKQLLAILSENGMVPPRVHELTRGAKKLFR